MATSGEWPPHIAQLQANLQEVELLVAAHHLLGGPGPGRKRNVEVLSKSAIVLVVACWEAYVEDLASPALKFQIENAKDHTKISKQVLDRVGTKYSGVNAWALAGDGWRKALQANLSEVLAKTTGALNTPKSVQVDELFLKTLGVPKMSNNWTWRGRTITRAVAALDSLVTLRGSIAHRVQHSGSVRKRHVTDAIQLISMLSAKSSNTVRTHVHRQIGKDPWCNVTFNSVG